MDLLSKLKILGGAAKYDVSCASSGNARPNSANGTGNTLASGICHSWAADGRCISLLKVLFSNACVFDCSYCACRMSNDGVRTSFTVAELVDLTMSFYRRNYIEGLFLSSGILGSPDHTMKKLIGVAKALREDHGFRGYIHLKIIPGAHSRLVEEAGRYADRMSVNLELPSEESLRLLAPQKRKKDIFSVMNAVDSRLREAAEDKKRLRAVPDFAASGQSTQLIVGASPESDHRILILTDDLYRRYRLKRVYFSAYVPLNDDPLLPKAKTPLLREHRLYQADWLMRFYRFRPEEIVSADDPNLDMALDPKLAWALRHLSLFPVEINRVVPDMLVRVPGIGLRSAQKIIQVRKSCRLDFDVLHKMGVPLNRAQYFITCDGKTLAAQGSAPDVLKKKIAGKTSSYEQLWLDL